MGDVDNEDIGGFGSDDARSSIELRRMMHELKARGVQIEPTGEGTIRFAIENAGIVEFEQVEGAGTFDPVDMGSVRFEPATEGAVRFTSTLGQRFSVEAVDGESGIRFTTTSEGELQFGPAVAGDTHFQPTQYIGFPAAAHEGTILGDSRPSIINENPVPPPKGVGPE